ncbi:hypothetical protein, partial [Enterococcus faecium]|uniref:hypothetical protein n=1 Tax=Enterococcus faecium TaxID=1352 RepID=UPI003DA11B57
MVRWKRLKDASSVALSLPRGKRCMLLWIGTWSLRAVLSSWKTTQNGPWYGHSSSVYLPILGENTI